MIIYINDPSYKDIIQYIDADEPIFMVLENHAMGDYLESFNIENFHSSKSLYFIPVDYNKLKFAHWFHSGKKAFATCNDNVREIILSYIILC